MIKESVKVPFPDSSDDVHIINDLTEDAVALKIGEYVDKSIRDTVRWTAPLGI